jgi:hypothetical protein
LGKAFVQVKSPVFIIGCYRGGTSLLMRLLSESRELWSLYRESNYMWKPWHRHPDEQADTVLLGANDLEAGDREYFDNHYHYSAYNTYILGWLSRVKFLREQLKPIFDLMNLGVYCYKTLFVKQYRIIDKTPPNAYRIAYLAKLYPDAKFIHLTRDGFVNTSSLMNAWRDKARFKFRYRKYLTKDKVIKIKDYNDDVWKFSIPPGWEQYLDKSLEEVCAFQWLSTHEYAIKAFSEMDIQGESHRYLRIKFENLLTKPHFVLKEVCDFANIDYSQAMRKLVDAMPLVNTASRPDTAKVAKNQEALDHIKPMIESMQNKLRYIENYAGTAR